MNPMPKAKLLEEILEEVIENGTEAILPVMQTLLNFAMKQERIQYLRAEPYERIARQLPGIGHANGYKAKTLQTRMGSMTVEIPQVRGLSFYPQSLEKGCRSERALKLAIADPPVPIRAGMYVNGVSTRKVARITETLCGLDISSTQVSRLSGSCRMRSLRPSGIEVWAPMPMCIRMPDMSTSVMLVMSAIWLYSWQ